MALPSREALESVLRFIFEVCRGMGASTASGLMFHRFLRAVRAHDEAVNCVCVGSAAF